MDSLRNSQAAARIALRHRAPPARTARRSLAGLAELARLGSPLALLLAWQIAASLGAVPPRILASPLQIAASAWRLTASGELPIGLAVSFVRVAAGFALGLAAGIGLGLLAGLSRPAEIVVDPLLQMLKALPFFGLLPLFILWFGIGEAPKLLLVAIGVVAPVYLTLFGGIRGIDPKLVDVARVYGLSRWQITLKLALPAALPSLLVGVRYGLSIAWLSLVIGEQINARDGIGAIISYARDFLQTDVIIVCLVVYAVMGLATDATVRQLERRVLRWRPGLPS
jgi:sulfonate transport system permease protein